MINPIKAIKAFFEVKSSVTEIIGEVKRMNSAKPGWKTSEFWGKIGVQVIAIWGVAQGFVPPKYAIIIGTGLEALYAVCRTISKAVTDIQAAKAEAAPAAPAVATATATAS